MKFKQFLTINAIMFIPFGIGMLVLPNLIFPMIAVDLDSDGLLMASTVGSMLLSFGIICFFARNENAATNSMKAIMIGNLVFHSIDCILTFRGAFSGNMNSFGYLFSVLHFSFALGFAYYLIKNKHVIN